MGELRTFPGRQHASAAPQPGPVLQRNARLTVEQARCFLMQLDGKTKGAGLPDAMFLLGRLAEHAWKLLEVVDSVCEP